MDEEFEHDLLDELGNININLSNQHMMIEESFRLMNVNLSLIEERLSELVNK